MILFFCPFFFLDKKEPTKSRMPDRLRAAFSPTLLDGYLSGFHLSGFLPFWRCKTGEMLSRKCVLPISIIKHAFIKL